MLRPTLDRNLDLLNGNYGLQKNQNQHTPTNGSSASFQPKLNSFFNRPQTGNSATNRSQSIGVSQSQQQVHSYLSPQPTSSKMVSQNSQSKLDMQVRSSQKVETSIGGGNFLNGRIQTVNQQQQYTALGSGNNNSALNTQKYLSSNVVNNQRLTFQQQEEKHKKNALYQVGTNGELQKYRSLQDINQMNQQTVYSNLDHQPQQSQHQGPIIQGNTASQFQQSYINKSPGQPTAQYRSYSTSKDDHHNNQVLLTQSPQHSSTNYLIDTSPKQQFLQSSKYKFFEDKKSPEYNAVSSSQIISSNINKISQLSYLNSGAQNRISQMNQNSIFQDQNELAQTTEMQAQLKQGQLTSNSFIQKQQQHLSYENYLQSQKPRSNVDIKNNRQLQISKQQQQQSLKEAQNQSQQQRSPSYMKNTNIAEGQEVPSSYLNTNTSSTNATTQYNTIQNRNAFQNISTNVMNQQNKQENQSGLILNKNNFYQNTYQSNIDKEYNLFKQQNQMQQQQPQQQLRESSNPNRNNSTLQTQSYLQQPLKTTNHNGQADERKSMQFQNNTSTGRFYSASKTGNDQQQQQYQNSPLTQNPLENQNTVQNSISNGLQQPSLQRKSNSTAQITQQPSAQSSSQTGFYNQYSKMFGPHIQSNNSQSLQQEGDVRPQKSQQIQSDTGAGSTQLKTSQQQLQQKINNFMVEKNENTTKGGLSPERIQNIQQSLRANLEQQQAQQQQQQQSQQAQQQSIYSQYQQNLNNPRQSYDVNKRTAQNEESNEQGVSQGQQLQVPQKRATTNANTGTTFLSGKNSEYNAQLYQLQQQQSQQHNQSQQQQQQAKGQANGKSESSMDQYITRVSRNDPLAGKLVKDVSQGQQSQQSQQTNQKPGPNANTNGSSGNGFVTLNKQAQQNNKKQLSLDDRDLIKQNQGLQKGLKEVKSTQNHDSQAQQFEGSKKQGYNTTTSAKTQNKHFFDKNRQNSQQQDENTDKNVLMIQKYNSQQQLKKKAQPFVYYQTNLEKHNKQVMPGIYFNQIYREHFLQSFQALTFCKLLRQPDQKTLLSKRVNLKKRESHKFKKTLIFDLDETLIHCNESLDLQSDVILPIKFPNGEIIEAGINIRPYALDILKELSPLFEIIVFTASHGCYANKVLDYLDPREQYIHHRIFRENCVVTEEGVYIKDLRIFEGCRNLEDLVIVDNACYSFGFHIDNGVPIIPFYENKSDEELKHLIPYLKQMINRDIQDLNRQTFKLSLYQQCESLDQVAKLVFDN